MASTSTAAAPSQTTPTSKSRSLPSSPKSSPPKSPPRDARDPVKRRSLQSTPIRHLADLANLALIVKRLSTRSGGELVVACDSGPEPQSHECVKDAQDMACADMEVIQTEHFICSKAVDLSILLRASRIALLERVRMIGGNTLMNERWSCKVRGPKSGIYRVHVEYAACPARSFKANDPGRPVALGNAKGIPGLMTVIERL